MDAASELGRNPVSKHQIQPEYGVEQTDAGRDCRTRFAKDAFNDWGGRECNNFVPVLGGNGTKIAPTGDIFEHPLVKCNKFGASLPIM